LDPMDLRTDQLKEGVRVDSKPGTAVRLELRFAGTRFFCGPPMPLGPSSSN